MLGRSSLALAAAAIVLALAPVAGLARPSFAPPVWESRVQQAAAQPGSGELIPGLRNRAGAPGEIYQFEHRVIAPNGQVQTALDLVNGAAWTSRSYPTGFEGAPTLMMGTYTFEFLVDGALVRRQVVTIGFTPFAPGCVGDEQLSFTPANPVAGQQFTIVATSSQASQTVALSGPGNPQFVGTGAGGRGTTWNYRVTLPTAGQYSYSFTVNSATCATASVTVGTNDAPPADAFWQLDYPRTVRLSERSSFELRIRNQNGRAGQQSLITLVVGTPGGPAYSNRIAVVGDSWATAAFPGYFPQAPPLQVGTYRVEWRSSAGVTLAADSIQVVR